MLREDLSQFERRCQKPDHRRIGSWMARRISRPAALRITRVVAGWGVSANMATLSAWACGAAAAAALAWGTIWGWIAGAVLLQLWYLLDHVDGQLARLHGTTSLDGVQLDYLMHHTINLVVPLGAGYGLFVRCGQPWWLFGGLLWALGLLLSGLEHDARYKAFIVRLKRLRGRLEVCGGGGGRPRPQPPAPRRPLRLVVWAARKACETHVIMNLLSMIALAQWMLADTRLLAGRVYLGMMGPIAVAVATWSIVRSQLNGWAEQEFARWYRVGPDQELVFSDGWWTVEAAEDGQSGSLASAGRPARQQSS